MLCNHSIVLTYYFTVSHLSISVKPKLNHSLRWWDPCRCLVPRNVLLPGNNNTIFYFFFFLSFRGCPPSWCRAWPTSSIPLRFLELSCLSLETWGYSRESRCLTAASTMFTMWAQPPLPSFVNGHLKCCTDWSGTNHYRLIYALNTWTVNGQSIWNWNEKNAEGWSRSCCSKTIVFNSLGWVTETYMLSCFSIIHLNKATFGVTIEIAFLLISVIGCNNKPASHRPSFLKDWFSIYYANCRSKFKYLNSSEQANEANLCCLFEKIIYYIAIAIRLFLQP